MIQAESEAADEKRSVWQRSVDGRGTAILLWVSALLWLAFARSVHDWSWVVAALACLVMTLLVVVATPVLTVERRPYDDVLSLRLGDVAAALGAPPAVLLLTLLRARGEVAPAFAWGFGSAVGIAFGLAVGCSLALRKASSE